MRPAHALGHIYTYEPNDPCRHVTELHFQGAKPGARSPRFASQWQKLNG